MVDVDQCLPLQRFGRVRWCNLRGPAGCVSRRAPAVRAPPPPGACAHLFVSWDATPSDQFQLTSQGSWTEYHGNENKSP
eukprot:3842471-Prymnesium_polylepis.2